MGLSALPDLSSNSSLQFLDLSDNQISDYSFLNDLKNLTDLFYHYPKKA
jgi:Leucine-rich repeat (LRR) protein